MIRIVVLLLLLAGCSTLTSRDDFPPALFGLPPCAENDHGFWNVYETKEGLVYLYLSMRNVKNFDPAYILCWVDPDHQIYMRPTHKQKELVYWNSSKRTSIFLIQDH